MTYQIESLKKLSKLELGNGDRLARVIAKGGKIGTKETESLGCVIPALSRNTIDLIMMNEAGFEFVRNAIYGVQDGLIRKAVENGKLTVFDGQIDSQAIIEAMATENESVRFSKESIKAWFEQYLKSPLHNAITSKMGAIPDAQINKLLDNYLVNLQTLAGRNASMSNAIKAGLIRAMEFLPADHDSVTATEIARRLSEVQEPSAMLAAL